jgi:hypothetical protein
LKLLLTEKDSFESSLFVNLLCNVINPPIQDCIILALIHLQTSTDRPTLTAQLTQCRFAERLLQIIETEEENVAISAMSLFQRILINTKDSIDFFLDGILSSSTPFAAMFRSFSDSNSSTNLKEHYVSLLQSMCTTNHQEMRNLMATFTDHIIAIFPYLFSKFCIVEYSVSIQVKLLQILVFFGKIDTRILELIDWEFYISGFFDRFKLNYLN